MTKIDIVLVHGFWGNSAHWSKVITRLRAKGFGSLHAVENPLTSLRDDVARTRQMIAQLDGPVLLVGHSYGGAVITEVGDMPSVAGLVYIAAFAPDAGESPGGISQAIPPAGLPSVAPDSDGYLWIKQDEYHANFCPDLPEEEGYVLAVTQKAPLAATFGDAITDPAWRKKPCWYQISSDDRMIDPRNQAMMSSRMNARKVITLKASHASLASMPDEVADFIAEAAGAV